MALLAIGPPTFSQQDPCMLGRGGPRWHQLVLAPDTSCRSGGHTAVFLGCMQDPHSKPAKEALQMEQHGKPSRSNEDARAG